MEQKTCLVCNVIFYKTSKTTYWDRRKYCSHKCYWDSKKGKTHNHGWKTGLKLKGVPKSPEHVKKVADALRGKRHPLNQGENHHAWKGDDVNYGSLHDWVARYRGREKKCDICGMNDEKRYYHWANISGQYKRDLSDWERLCVPCHKRKYKNDHEMKKLWKKVGNEYIRIKIS